MATLAMSSPVNTTASLPRNPSPSPPSHRPVIPRSQPPRPQSNPSIRPPRRPSTPHANSQPTLSSGSSPSDSAVLSAGAGPSTTASAPMSKGAGSNPVSTSTPPTSVPSLASANTAVPQKVRSNSSSSTSLSAAVSMSAGPGVSASQGVTATPQTGASKMAAAAKARAEGYAKQRRGSDVEGDDHPLSEASLKARDYHTICTLNRLFHVPTRWQLIRPLGQGAYGLVVQVQDTYTGEPVAVKCITRVFDKVILARRALREITLLRHFGGHENLTGLIDLDNVWDGFNEIYLYMEPMEADLHQIVRSGQPLSNSHIQFFTYQLLRGMKYIHSADVIHRDLKPGNLLVNSDCELKICDFGLARGYNPHANAEDGLKLTEYVATRWYRAPEVMLSNSSYSTAMDVWSIGCILAELLGGKPLFKGKDYVDQINLIVAAVGSPDEETLTRVGSEKACMYMRTLPHSDPVDLQSIIPAADTDAIDLLHHLIAFDPDRRYDVVQALEHPYVGSYHVENDEPSCPAKFDRWEQVESLKTIEELREAISLEIQAYRREVREMADSIDDEDSDRSSLGAFDEDIEMLNTENVDADETIRVDQVHEVTRSSPELLHANLGMVGGISPRSMPDAPPTSRGRERDRSPHTPASVFSEDSTPGPSQPPSAPPSVSGGRTSRRSSGHSMHRARSSFLFSSPLGGGMTPLPSMSAIVPMTSADGAGHSPSHPTGHHHGHGHGHRSGSIDAGPAGWKQGRKSRAASSSSEFASLRPLIRQLSVVGLEALGMAEAGADGVAKGDRGQGGIGGGMSEVPPMTVSPSDAPPSERPKSFAPSPA